MAVDILDLGPAVSTTRDALPRSAKDDLVDSVHIEMERMFGILENMRNPAEPALLRQIESALRATLRRFGTPTSVLDIN
jgi:hypothetical protein